MDRLIFTISKRNRPNDTDLKALKNIADFIDNMNKREDILFAKLYVFLFYKKVSHYEETMNSDYSKSQRYVHEILKRPLDFIIEKAMQEANEVELHKYLESKGLDKQHFEQSKGKINEEEFKQYLDGVYDIDMFKHHIERQINEAIKAYKHRI